MNNIELDHYGDALDEIWRLRALLAYEAQVVEAHLDYKTFPKSRRTYAEDQVERMKAAARGDLLAQMKPAYPKRALAAAGADAELTRAQWERSRARPCN